MVAISFDAIYFCPFREDFTELVDSKGLYIVLLLFRKVYPSLNNRTLMDVIKPSEGYSPNLLMHSKINIVIGHVETGTKITVDQCVQFAAGAHILQCLIHRVYKIAVFWKYNTELIAGKGCADKLQFNRLLQLDPRNRALTFNLVRDRGVNVTGGKCVKDCGEFLVS